jgi:hypothetical protein
MGKTYLDGDAFYGFEPHVAEKVFNDLVREAKVTVVLGERLDLAPGSVQKDGPRIIAIRMESGRIFRGKAFIDCTYEGDLMAKAGVKYTVGRESSKQYGEASNGVHLYTGPASRKPIDPYVTPGDPASGLLPRLQLPPLPRSGEADGGVQAYNYRLCLTQNPANKIPFEKPADYDEREIELLFRLFEAGGQNLPGFGPVELPGGKTDTNNNGSFSTDCVEMSESWAEADYATRQKLEAAHIRYTKSLLWALANHPRVPAEVRAECAKWGHAKDEFIDNGNWPYQIYVREARRMIGRYVMTEHEVQGRRDAPEPVALGSYFMDCHLVRRWVDEKGYLRHDGGLSAPRGFPPYGISYRSLTPEAEQCTNLLVTICLSASHSAYGSIRMEPVYMMVAEAAGDAAALSIERGTSVQQVDYAALKSRLESTGSVLIWPPASFTGVRAKQLPGIVMDETGATRTGKWTTGGNVAGVDGHYMHDGNAEKGKLFAVYKLTVPADGRYEVRVSYVAHANRATNTPVVIDHADGRAKVAVNQREKPPIDGLFKSLGVYTFSAAQPATVTIHNTGTDGFVVIDAVQLVPVK